MSENEALVGPVKLCLETPTPRGTQIELDPDSPQGELELGDIPAESAGFLSIPPRYVFTLREPGPRFHRILTVMIKVSCFHRNQTGFYSLDQDAQRDLRIGVTGFFNSQRTTNKGVLHIG